MDPPRVSVVTPQTTIATLFVNAIDDDDEERLLEIFGPMVGNSLPRTEPSNHITTKYGDESIEEFTKTSGRPYDLDSLVQELNGFITITTEVH
jgi:hypothetical protein